MTDSTYLVVVDKDGNAVTDLAVLYRQIEVLQRRLNLYQDAIREHQETCPEYEEGPDVVDGIAIESFAGMPTPRKVYVSTGDMAIELPAWAVELAMSREADGTAPHETGEVP